MGWESSDIVSFDLCPPPFKVKQWFSGFGELSFWWIQICIGPPMGRSSYAYFYPIVLPPLTSTLQLRNFTASQVLVYELIWSSGY